MILLDTHVTLELMKTRPSDAVVAWLNGQASEKLFVSAITIREVA
jgi:predicted nucleic acid-binding protein